MLFIGGGLRTCPHRPVIKAMLFHGLWFDPKIIDLPFSGRRSGIAKFLHQSGKSGVLLFLPVKVSNSPARHIPMVCPSRTPGIFPCKQGRAGGCARRHGVGIVKLHATCCEGVNIGCFNILGSVATDPLLAQIICHDEENIWLRLGGFRKRE